MKKMNNVLRFCLMLLVTTTMVAQETDEAKTTEKESANSFKKIKLDGIAAVVGDHVILESDIEKFLIDLKSQEVSEENYTRCSVLGSLMEERLYAHQAVQDSILVSDDEVNATSERQIQELLTRVESMKKILQIYKKETEVGFREELYKINKLRLLSNKMQQNIVSEIEITPEEVRQFFNKIPKEDRPILGTQLEIAQIVKEPKASDEEKQKVIDKLNAIRSDVIDNGASFKVKAILYTEDTGSRGKGGFYTITKETGFVKEFKDVAFSLKEGEISEPFETIYGYHIIYLEKIRGQELDVRHIIMSPKVSNEDMEEARKELMDIRKKIEDGEFTFAEAALNFSDQKETKFEGGQLRNPITFDTKFELTNMESTMYNQIREMKDNEISQPIMERDPRGGTTKFKIMMITNRYDEHVADFAQDYIKIQELALSEKRVNTIKKWMEKHIEDAYISVNKDNRDCDFTNKWVKE